MQKHVHGCKRNLVIFSQDVWRNKELIVNLQKQSR